MQDQGEDPGDRWHANLWGHHGCDGGDDDEDEVGDDARGCADDLAGCDVHRLALSVHPDAAPRVERASGGGAERDDQHDRGHLGERGAVVVRHERLFALALGRRLRASLGAPRRERAQDQQHRRDERDAQRVSASRHRR